MGGNAINFYPALILFYIYLLNRKAPRDPLRKNYWKTKLSSAFFSVPSVKRDELTGRIDGKIDGRRINVRRRQHESRHRLATEDKDTTDKTQAKNKQDKSTDQRIESTIPPDPFCNYKIKKTFNKDNTRKAKKRKTKSKKAKIEKRKVKNGRRRQKEQGPPSVNLEVSS